MLSESSQSQANAELVHECRRRAVMLLTRNLGPDGILAATASPQSSERGYTAIFGRDAAICALGMAVSDDTQLCDAAASGLVTLARHQAANGQMPKFVDTASDEADFWYLGCIDSTLWWLIALALLDARSAKLRLRERYASQIALAIQWLRAQEHQRFFLLQQNEASDWADIMPRSGFVLYTNALWFYLKRLYSLDHLQETQQNINGLFHPFSAQLAPYRRARLLADYPIQNARHRDLYLSFVNFSFFGDEGDVFGNLLTLLAGAMPDSARQRTMDALVKACVSDPYPVRATCEPIVPGDRLWRAYMARHDQNFAWQYHNGGIWPMLGGFWVVALVQQGQYEHAAVELAKLARACALNDWEFNEWLHGQTLEPRGMPGQSWNAAAFLMAEYAVRKRETLF